MATSLPREPVGRDGIFPVDIANAIMGLRINRIVSVQWEIRPSVGIVAKDVQRLGMDIRSFKAPLATIVKTVLIPSIRKNFQEGGRPAWEPLAESTVRARHFAAWPILNRTGKLQKRATQFGIWDIGQTSATVRRLPADAFYGVYHQAGAGGGNGAAELAKHKLGSPGANALIAKFIPHARKELGPKATPKQVQNRALGMLADESSGWNLPARPFIMYQDEDVPKMEAVFGAWMEERAIKVGRFHPGV